MRRHLLCAVPAPGSHSISPALTSRSRARRTVLRFIPDCFARTRVPASRSPFQPPRGGNVSRLIIKRSSASPGVILAFGSRGNARIVRAP